MGLDDQKERCVLDDHCKILLEQYKVYVPTADKISDRRGDANKFYITLLTGLLTLFSILISIQKQIPVFMFALISIAVLGVTLCWLWYKTINSYAQLNSGKYIIINKIEDELAFKCFDEEWTILGKGKDKKIYDKLTDVEKRVPWIFGIAYSVLLVVALGFIIYSYYPSILHTLTLLF